MKVKLPLVSKEFLTEIQKEYDQSNSDVDKDIKEKQYRLVKIDIMLTWWVI